MHAGFNELQQIVHTYCLNGSATLAKTDQSTLNLAQYSVKQKYSMRSMRFMRGGMYVKIWKKLRKVGTKLSIVQRWDKVYIRWQVCKLRKTRPWGRPVLPQRTDMVLSSQSMKIYIFFVRQSLMTFVRDHWHGIMQDQCVTCSTYHMSPTNHGHGHGVFILATNTPPGFKSNVSLCRQRMLLFICYVLNIPCDQSEYLKCHQCIIISLFKWMLSAVMHVPCVLLHP